MAFLLTSLGARAQWKDYKIGVKGDTLNKLDKKDQNTMRIRRLADVIQLRKNSSASQRIGLEAVQIDLQCRSARPATVSAH